MRVSDPVAPSRLPTARPRLREQALQTLAGISCWWRAAPLERSTLLAITAVVARQWFERLARVRTEFDLFATGLTAGLILVAALGVRDLVARAATPAGRRRRLTVIAACSVLPAIAATHVVSSRWHADFDAHYDRFFHERVFGELNKKFPAAEPICVLDLKIYPFFGSARQRRVCRPRYIESYDWLLQYLDEKEIRLVATHRGSRGWTFDMYREVPGWLAQHPDRFKVEIVGAEHIVYSYQSGRARN